MERDQIVTEEHHRRPRSIGGKETPANVSNVKGVQHRNWHTLFGNKNADQICDWLNNDCPYKPEGVKIVCKFINGTRVTKFGKNCSKKQSKISSAWQSLFKELEFDEIVRYINNVWLDPSYHLYIETE